MVKSLFGRICGSIETFWQNFRNLFHRNDTLFDLVFLFVYFLEELGLIFFIIINREKPNVLPYVVAFFTLILVTTVGTHRLMMESKNKYIKTKTIQASLRYFKLESEYHLLDKEYKKQIEIFKDMIEENEKLFKENLRLKKLTKKK